jgi:ribose transport system substrate-binding protein
LTDQRTNAVGVNQVANPKAIEVNTLKPPRIGYASNNTRFTFWAFVENGARVRALELGATLATLPATNSDEQAEAIDELVRQQIDLLMISPIDRNGPDFIAALQAARAAKIPIITCESGLAGKPDFAICDIRSNLRRAAEVVTQHMLEQLGREGKIIHLPGTDSRPRSEGFYQALEQQPGVEIVFEGSVDWTRGHAAEVMRTALLERPDAQAVFAHSDEIALGAIAAIDAAGRSGELIVCGVDAMPEALNALRTGLLSATANLMPHQIGRLALETGLRILRQEAPPPVIESPIVLVTRANLLDAALDELIQLPQIVQALGESNSIQRQLQQQMISAQRSIIHDLSTPIVPINDQILVLPLVGAIDTTRAQQIMEAMLRAIEQQRAQVLIVDITGIAVVDTQVANYLLQSAQAARLLGAHVILVGIAPEVAQTIVQLGIDLSSIMTRSTLKDGLRLATTL